MSSFLSCFTRHTQTTPQAHPEPTSITPPSLVPTSLNLDTSTLPSFSSSHDQNARLNSNTSSSSLNPTHNPPAPAHTDNATQHASLTSAVVYQCRLPGCTNPMEVLATAGLKSEYCSVAHATADNVHAPYQAIRPATCSLLSCDRPCYIDQDNAILHDFCGLTHAMQGNQTQLLRKQLPSSTVHVIHHTPPGSMSSAPQMFVAQSSLPSRPILTGLDHLPTLHVPSARTSRPSSKPKSQKTLIQVIIEAHTYMSDDATDFKPAPPRTDCLPDTWILPHDVPSCIPRIDHND